MGAVGTQAPDLIFTEHLGDPADHNHNTTVLKSKELASGQYSKTLLIFYESGCGPCENLLQQLPGNYDSLKKKGLRIIAISADTDDKVFKEKSKDFLWKDTFCDLEGKKGINFKNYGIAGTPTLFLISKAGKIEARMAGLDEVLDKIK
jgi:thiol-disulfide isomerase/thioredoxin